MRKLLNTIYVTNEQSYLMLDGENLVCKINGEEKLRIPFDNVENIICFNYIGCSPALMGKCVEKCIPINFVSPHGKFLAKIYGETKGNVFLRVAQIDCFKNNFLELSQNTIAAKLLNSKQLIKRFIHDNPELKNNCDVKRAIDSITVGIDNLYKAKTTEEIMGIEGKCASDYFSAFNHFITNPNVSLTFEYRTKRPPLDEVNAVLSFLYTIATIDYAAALETVGLDSYIGFCHSLRSGRNSLACDMVEELRPVIDRFVLKLINLRIVTEKDFEKQISGAVFLTEDGRKKVLSNWQEKKRADTNHPFLNKKIQFGLIPYIQCNLLAKYVRGDITEYPPYLQK